MVAYHNIYDSLTEFIAGMDAQKVLTFYAPADLQARVETLFEKKKEIELSEREKEELDHFFILEHIVRLAKSRAKLKIAKAA